MKKKYYIIGLCVVVLIALVIALISIFHYDVITCTDSIKEDKYTIKSTYKIYHKKDIVKKVEITREVDSKNTTILSFFEKNYKDEFEKYNKEYNGYKIKSSKTKDKMILNITWNVKDAKLDKLLEKRSFLKEDVIKDKKKKKVKQLKVDGVYKLFNLNKNNCK